MVKLELGIKRHCSGCGARFYDLNKNPIVCPKCHTVLELTAVSARARPNTAPPARAIKPAAEEEGTSLLGAGAVHHIRLCRSRMSATCPLYPQHLP